jgi:hypothetical protein
VRLPQRGGALPPLRPRRAPLLPTRTHLAIPRRPHSQGLVDGVVTDDSDVFLFGVKRVYRHIFEHGQYAESYHAEDVQRELGLTRDKLVSLVRPLYRDLGWCESDG